MLALRAKNVAESWRAMLLAPCCSSLKNPLAALNLSIHNPFAPVASSSRPLLLHHRRQCSSSWSDSTMVGSPVLPARTSFCRRVTASDHAADPSSDPVDNVKETIQGGAIHLLLGPMFAGKTTALLQRIQSEADAGRKIALVKSDKDTRYGLSSIVSHTGKKMPCAAVASLEDFKALKPDLYTQAEVIGIDEAQFFDDLLSFCQSAADFDHKTLIVAGLDGDFLRRRFGSALDLIPLADSVTKLSSRCEMCNRPAAFTFRKTYDQMKELIGGADIYMPVCRKHYVAGQFAIESTRTVLQADEQEQQQLDSTASCC